MTSFGNWLRQSVAQFMLMTFRLLFISAILRKLITISLLCAALGWRLQVPQSGNNVIITMEICILMHFNCIVMGWALVHTGVHDTSSKSGTWLLVKQKHRLLKSQRWRLMRNGSFQTEHSCLILTRERVNRAALLKLSNLFMIHILLMCNSNFSRVKWNHS